MRYVIKFTKDGYAKYTSHLDMVRLFKRLLKIGGIRLKYSQGFNPHPKMSFAQPLSLGYSSDCELLEIETLEDYEPAYIAERLRSSAPCGIGITDCKRMEYDEFSYAANTLACIYKIEIPLSFAGGNECNSGKEEAFNAENVIENYLSQNEIIVQKKRKKGKTKEFADVNIRPMIRRMNGSVEKGVYNKLVIDVELDAGSKSNLSPEHVISSFVRFAGINTDRTEIEIRRIGFSFEE